MSKNSVIEVSSPGAVTLSKSCIYANCTNFDFVYSDTVVFPLTFKVLTTIEGVYNHTSALVTVTNNTKIRSCEYS
jgi:hypothetical protein